MSSQHDLIARKQEVRRRIEQVQRQLDALQGASEQQRRQVRKLEGEIERLMAEEYRLRVAIDQSR